LWRLVMTGVLAATVVLYGGFKGCESPRHDLRPQFDHPRSHGTWARMRTSTVGHSSQGRRIAATGFGNPHAPLRVLVIGCVHGDECAGRAVVQRLLADCPPLNADIWTIENLNPDGFALSRRVNGRGVDLNRNFSAGWRASGRRWDPEFSGPRPFSEPETRAVKKLIRSLRPDITLWYHQQQEALVRAWGQSAPAARRFARAVGLPFHRLRWLSGTAPNWQNHRFAGASSFVVELPRGPVARRTAAHHAAAIKRIGGERRLVLARTDGRRRSTTRRVGLATGRG
jgi:protein MpaA